MQGDGDCGGKFDTDGDSGLSNLGLARLPEVSAKYPHMMPEDRIIWRRFVGNGLYLPDVVWYDVHVGKAVEVASGQPEWMHKFSEYSTRKRIDIVGRKGLDYWVIEAKPRAGIVALGQAVFYSLAFMEEYEHVGEVIPMVVTDVVDEDVRPILDLLGVVVFEVGREEEE